MMEITVASWNIEKSGQSSTIEKQTKVSHFIDECCTKLKIDIVFLCEVHSARINDYIDFFKSAYTDYEVEYFEGGNSNNYILLVKNTLSTIISKCKFIGINRNICLMNFGEDKLQPFKFSLALAHFKSGQSRLTQDQITNLAESLQSMTPNRWLILGDMNWDFTRITELEINNAQGICCWNQTQRRGGNLDWCLYSNSRHIMIKACDFEHYFPQEIYDMQGPDHRPIIFIINLRD